VWGGRLALAVGAFLAVSLFLYAPRAPDGLGLWSALASPTRLPALVQATVEDVSVGYSYWFGGASDPGCNKETVIGGYVCYLQRFLQAMGAYAAPLSALALVGLVSERYGRRAPRNVVLAAGYWGVVSVVGYPLGTDIWGAWIVVNALVPLTIPAAVGAGVLVDWGLGAAANRDLLGAGLVAAVVVGGAAVSGAAVVSDVYGQPAAPDNDLVQYAQPSSDLRPALTHLRDGVDDTDRTDLLVYGSAFVDGDAEAPRRPPCVKWFQLLPMPWYTEAAGADVTCATEPSDLPDSADGLPPLILAPADQRATLDPLTEGYETATFDLRRGGRTAVLYYRTGESGPTRTTRTTATMEAGAVAVRDGPSPRLDGSTA
jgi:uncharacterized protein (TIGR03663 family)